MTPAPLQIGSHLDVRYPDVFTPQALATLAAVAPLDADRQAIMRAPIERRAARARDRTPIDFLDAAAVIPRTQPHGAGRPRGRLRRQRDSRRSAATMDPGHRSCRATQRTGRNQHAQRRLCAALGRRRLDVRRRGRARTGVHDVARQPAQPQAGHSSRCPVPDCRRAGGCGNERVGAGILRTDD